MPTTTTLQVTFVSESAAYNNTFGWYNSQTGMGGILFADVESLLQERRADHVPARDAAALWPTGRCGGLIVGRRARARRRVLRMPQKRAERSCVGDENGVVTTGILEPYVFSMQPPSSPRRLSRTTISGS